MVLMTGSRDPIHVLHLDDDSALVDVVATYLEREDDRIEVRTATSPTEGLAVVADEPVDCFVSDHEMPGATGIEVLESLREEYPDLPFILYTGKGSEEVASEAISAGVTDYLQKEGGTDQYAILANRVVNAVERYRAERQAAETRSQLRAISENSSDAIVIMDADSRVRFANPAVEAHFGYTPAELEGDRLTKIMPDRLRQRHLAAVDDYLETGERSLDWSNIEFPGLRKDGTEVPLSLSFGAFEQDGEARFLGILRDISERTRMDAELREREEQFRQLAENIGEVVWMSDPEKAEILYVNPTYEELWGRTVETLYEEPLSFLDQVHPEDRDRVEAALETQPTGDYEEEYRIVRPDGDQRWVWDRAIPVADDAGDVYRIVGVATDITERKEREREYERTIDFLQRLYDVATSIDLDVTEKVTQLLQAGPSNLDLPPGYLTRIEVNAESAGGGTQRVIEASGDHDLLQPGEACPLSRSYCRKTIKGDDILEIPDAKAAGWEGDPAYELFDLGCYIGSPIRLDDELYGTVFYAAETPRGEPFTDAERTFVRLTSQLVSYELQRQRTTDRLERRNERLAEFANIVSHDLRNPLTVAAGKLELAREECESDHLDGVVRVHERMQVLIDDLLTLAQDGDAAADVEPVSLPDCCETCWENVGTGAATLVVETEDTIIADRGQFQQLLENLYRNAVEHGSDDVTVTVGSIPGGIYVEDDGPGVPEGLREEVFRAGYSTRHNGTGFGLSIVEQVVESHGWDVRVTDASGGGARFEITDVEFVE
jgi:PAS domain S-box-containing protein